MSEALATPAEVAPSEPTDSWSSQSATPDGGVDAAEPAQPEPPAAVVEADAAEAAAEPVDRDDKGQFTSNKKARKTSPYEAVKQATGETAKERGLREAAEARAAAVEKELAALKAKPAPAAAVDPPRAAAPQMEPGATRPKPNEDEIGTKYATYADFVEDLADWRYEQRIAKDDINARIAQAFQQRDAQVSYQQHVGQVFATGRTTYPDFDAVVNASTVLFPPKHQQVILASANPSAVMYALAKDHALAQTIAGIDLDTPQTAVDNAIRLGVELASLLSSATVAARPDSTVAARTSSAKPPINRVGGTASAVPVDPDDLEFGPEFIKAENAREKQKREANRW